MSDGSRWRSCVAQSAIAVGTRGPDDRRFAFLRARRHQDGHRALAAAIGDASAASRCDPGNRTSVVCSNVPDPSASATRWRFVGRENAGSRFTGNRPGFGMKLGTVPSRATLSRRSGIRSTLGPPMVTNLASMNLPRPCVEARHAADCGMRTTGRGQSRPGNAEFESGARRSELPRRRQGTASLVGCPQWANRNPPT